MTSFLQFTLHLVVYPCWGMCQCSFPSSSWIRCLYPRQWRLKFCSAAPGIVASLALCTLPTWMEGIVITWAEVSLQGKRVGEGGPLSTTQSFKQWLSFSNIERHISNHLGLHREGPGTVRRLGIRGEEMSPSKKKKGLSWRDLGLCPQPWEAEGPQGSLSPCVFLIGPL